MLIPKICKNAARLRATRPTANRPPVAALAFALAAAPLSASALVFASGDVLPVYDGSDPWVIAGPLFIAPTANGSVGLTQNTAASADGLEIASSVDTFGSLSIGTTNGTQATFTVNGTARIGVAPNAEASLSAAGLDAFTQALGFDLHVGSDQGAVGSATFSNSGTFSGNRPLPGRAQLGRDLLLYGDEFFPGSGPVRNRGRVRVVNAELLVPRDLVVGAGGAGHALLQLDERDAALTADSLTIGAQIPGTVELIDDAGRLQITQTLRVADQADGTLSAERAFRGSPLITADTLLVGGRRGTLATLDVHEDIPAQFDNALFGGDGGAYTGQINFDVTGNARLRPTPQGPTDPDVDPIVLAGTVGGLLQVGTPGATQLIDGTPVVAELEIDGDLLVSGPATIERNGRLIVDSGELSADAGIDIRGGVDLFFSFGDLAAPNGDITFHDTADTRISYANLDLNGRLDLEADTQLGGTLTLVPPSSGPLEEDDFSTLPYQSDTFLRAQNGATITGTFDRIEGTRLNDTWSYAVIYQPDRVAAFRVLTGDGDFSRSIEQADLDLVLINWGQSGKTWVDGDYNGNGVIEQADLDAVLTNWGSTAAPSFALNPALVPEPGTALLLLFALMGAQRPPARAATRPRPRGC